MMKPVMLNNGSKAITFTIRGNSVQQQVAISNISNISMITADLVWRQEQILPTSDLTVVQMCSSSSSSVMEGCECLQCRRCAAALLHLV